MILSKLQQKQIREAYNAHFKGKNWGSWQVEQMPNVGIGFQLLQYENDNGAICDVIKFDKDVALEGSRKNPTNAYHFQFKPNHDTRHFPTFNTETATKCCTKCGIYKPIDGSWWTSRVCSECGKEDEIKAEIFLQKLQEAVNSENWNFFNFQRIRHNSPEKIKVKAEAILKSNPNIWEYYKKWYIF